MIKHDLHCSQIAELPEHQNPDILHISEVLTSQEWSP